MTALDQTIQIVSYSDKHREQLLNVWEKSVLATHNFLAASCFNAIKKTVHTIDFKVFDVFCLLDSNKVVGFIGIAEQKIEMLFLLPEYIGKGHGKKLMKYVIQKLKAKKVDVNEQNKKAVEFYTKFGFVTFERTEKDDLGYNYPLLRMELKTKNLSR